MCHRGDDGCVQHCRLVLPARTPSRSERLGLYAGNGVGGEANDASPPQVFRGSPAETRRRLASARSVFVAAPIELGHPFVALARLALARGARGRNSERSSHLGITPNFGIALHF